MIMIYTYASIRNSKFGRLSRQQDVIYSQQISETMKVTWNILTRKNDMKLVSCAFDKVRFLNSVDMYVLLQI